MNSAFEQRLAALGYTTTEVEERFVLGSGRGGQKIQKTSSCVWLRHGPSGVEVRCQRERSQALNRLTAWTELCEKLESRAKTAAAQRQDESERTRRRLRQKSRGQKLHLVRAKKHRAGIRSNRGKVERD